MSLYSFARSVIAIGFFFVAHTVWASSKPLVDAPLTWRPTSTIQDFKIQPIDLNQIRGGQIYIMPFTNSCSDRTLIGENREDEDKPKTVHTNTDVSDFVTNHTKDILKPESVSGLPGRPFGPPEAPFGSTLGPLRERFRSAGWVPGAADDFWLAPGQAHARVHVPLSGLSEPVRRPWAAVG